MADDEGGHLRACGGERRPPAVPQLAPARLCPPQRALPQLLLLALPLAAMQWAVQNGLGIFCSSEWGSGLARAARTRGGAPKQQQQASAAPFAARPLGRALWSPRQPTYRMHASPRPYLT